MRRIFAFFFLVIFFLLLLGCQTNNDDISKLNNIDNKKYHFAIYLVAKDGKNRAVSYGRYDKGTYIHEGLDNINELKLEKEPLLTDKDIVAYHWNSQEIELSKEYLSKASDNKTKSKSKLTPGLEGGSSLLNTEEFDQFTIVVDGKRIYSGGFPLSPIRSQFPPEVGIEDSGSNRIRIWYYGLSEKDPRNMRPIYNLFEQLGKLKE